MNKNKYFYSLDLFRGFCGYGVAICHLYAFVFSNQFMEYLSIIFVEFFFVLSGFVLYPQLLKVLNKKNNLLKFYKRRWIRTLPLFFLLLILVTILTDHLTNINFLKYFLLIHKVIPDFIENDYYPVAWSLSIEEFFYLLFPLILVLLNDKNFIKFSLLIFFIIILIKYFSVANFDPNYYRTGTLLRFDAILFGFLISHFRFEILRYKKMIIIFTVLLLFLFLFNYNFFIINKIEPNNRFIFILFMQLISGLTLLSFILMEPLIKNIFIKKFSLLISKQTYSIYLFHIIIIYLLANSNFSAHSITIVYIILLFTISTLIYYFFEEPLLKLRPKITN